MLPPGTTARLASTLALLAVLLRVVLPALHTHAHDHPGPATSHTAPTPICSCGARHAEDDRGGERCTPGDAALGVDHCLSCEIEAGTPCDCPPAHDWRAPGAPTNERAPLPMRDVLVDSLVALPRSRAPPADDA